MAITLSATRNRHVEFVASVPLDLINAMYFIALAQGLEGLDDWPVSTRDRIDAGLRYDLDLLVAFPHGEAGLIGSLNDAMFVHRETWGGIEDLLRFVRELPAGGTGNLEKPGIQGLAYYALRYPCDTPFDLGGGAPSRDDVVRSLEANGDLPGGVSRSDAMRLFDEPEQTRARLLTLIRRFYDEHYRPDQERRIACMERSVAAHRRDTAMDPEELSRRLSRRSMTCLESVCAGEHREYIFVPSVDVGPYNSCVNLPDLHALYYPCEREYQGVPAAEADATHRMALVYRALGDEQRLRILGLLRGGELYVQEIVERTGLHQSVVSRHLSFMKAVGLVNARRQNNMKYYSLNSDAGGELRRAVDAFLPEPAAR
ncbi:MAG: ArsR family transcriptional regulator [Dehalococcoidia bacterium]|nr:MAG: ArsR family transcriptional regulator [Dehalococcoidia bacterium]